MNTSGTNGMEDLIHLLYLPFSTEGSHNKRCLGETVAQIQAKNSNLKQLLAVLLKDVKNKESAVAALREFTDSDCDFSEYEMLFALVERMNFPSTVTQADEPVTHPQQSDNGEDALITLEQRDFNEKQSFLKNLKDQINISIYTFDDGDYVSLRKDAVTYATTKFATSMGTTKFEFESLSYSDKTLDPRIRSMYVEVIDLVVMKAGKIRMMVRFNNSPIKISDGAATKSVKDSYGRVNGNALFLDESNPGVEFRGYKLDPTEKSGEVGMYQKLTLKPELKTEDKETLHFERIFLEEDQQAVYDSLKSFIFSAKFNAPLGIFAYGGTGSGKTYTLLGPPPEQMADDNEGILSRVVREQWEIEDNSKIEVRMMEIHPIMPDTTNKSSNHENHLLYRGLDLVEMRNNNGLRSNGNGVEIIQDRQHQSQVTYFEMTVDAKGKGDTRLLKRIKLGQKGVTELNLKKQEEKTGFSTLYDSTVNIKDRSEAGVFNKVNQREAFNALTFTKKQQGFADVDVDTGTIISKINEVLKYRRVESTRGNQSGSSRSHLVITIDVHKKELLDNEPRPMSTFYIVDLAGKEYASPKEPYAKNPLRKTPAEQEKLNKWQVSTGINRSLDGFMRLVGVKKCGIEFDLGDHVGNKSVHDADTKLRAKANQCIKVKSHKVENMPHINGMNYVNRNSTIFKGIHYNRDPLYFVTDPLWSDDGAKMMLFACMYPLVQEEIDGNTFPDSWDKFFGNVGGEKIDEKFLRDISILREMNYVQKVEGKVKKGR